MSWKEYFLCADNFRSYEIHQPGILLMSILLLLLLIMLVTFVRKTWVRWRAGADSALHVGHKLTAMTFHIPVIYSISSICTSIDYIGSIESRKLQPDANVIF